MKHIFSVLITMFLMAPLVSAQTAEQKLTSLIRDTDKANTDAVLNYKDGQVIYEYYAREYGPNTKHLSWSTAKTITAILIGIAEKEGLLSVDDKVKKYFPQFKNEARIIDELQMASGIHFKEAFGGFPSHLDLTNM
ncbi:MAG: serine hydrolase, partial [Bdellovibrionaceae bacterium]|nr:serine hydrolase [Pseudobdellovibrionaceae bacterium]